MALSEIDATLISRCLQKAPNAWDDFVERFMPLVHHVVKYTCETRGIPLSAELRDDLVQEVFVGILKDNYVVLRRFRGNSSLATYLTVVARRIVVRNILQKKLVPEIQPVTAQAAMATPPTVSGEEKRIENADEVEHLLTTLSEKDAAIVRMYHLEQKSYAEIAAALNIPENSIGPTLSRARESLRNEAQKKSV